MIGIGAAIYTVLDDPEGDWRSFAAIALAVSGLLLHFRGRRFAAKTLADGALNPWRDTRADVLYLRTFRSDATGLLRKVFSGLSSDEEQLALALQPFGHMIAIGQPGESLPLPGAVRAYASDDQWQQVVLERMRTSSLVVLRAGAGAGLNWELEQIKRYCDPTRVLILVRNLTLAEYVDFAVNASRRTGLALPPLRSCGLTRVLCDPFQESPSKVLPGFIRFAASWQASYLALPPGYVRWINFDSKRYRSALAPVLQAHSNSH
jgi:hypothetical protein